MLENLTIAECSRLFGVMPKDITNLTIMTIVVLLIALLMMFAWMSSDLKSRQKTKFLKEHNIYEDFLLWSERRRL